MKLKAWLEREGISNPVFGAKIGRTAEAVRRYAEGLRVPDRDTMPLIVRETGGEVRPDDFFDIADALSDPAAHSERSSSAEAA